jgi:ferritin-like metal-binding protein YciE
MNRGAAAPIAKQLGETEALTLPKETLENATDEKLSMLALQQTNPDAAKAGKAK